uniref:non-specific serine/threonine protein kinase n=1 Tax=Compsopogon caeruleus TaxID=31354 RepID=A0A7S1TIK4_9RHOD|mmetsp:Transcript_9013/g.18184  ORF Transcript_9013/g.18184 Transcript_9013/m.18184 type:complete len:949 (+) Transcript_9013:71-2917(+)
MLRLGAQCALLVWFVWWRFVWVGRGDEVRGTREVVGSVLTGGEAGKSWTEDGLVVVSTYDGAVEAYAARTGDRMWRLGYGSPSVSSHTTGGWPEIIPGVDGSIFCADPSGSNRLMMLGPTVYVDVGQERRSGVVVSRSERKVLYVDAENGELLRELAVEVVESEAETELWMSRRKHRKVVVLSRVEVNVQVRDAASGKVMSNATMVHTSTSLLFKGKCVVEAPTSQGNELIVDVATDRESLTLREQSSGKILWIRPVSGLVMDATGLNGVRISPAGHPLGLIRGGEVILRRVNGQSMADRPREKFSKNWPSEARYHVRLGSPDASNFLPLSIGRNLYSEVGMKITRSQLRPTFDAKLVSVALLCVFLSAVLTSCIVKPRDRKPNGSQGSGREVLRGLMGGGGSNPPSSDPDRSGGTSLLRSSGGESWTIGKITVSNKVLGYGSHGTVVYEGTLEPGSRRVAVKRLLRQFYDAARKEISMLIELDEISSHIVRYYAMEEDAEFLYLALELCNGTLADRVTSSMLPGIPLSPMGGHGVPEVTMTALHDLMTGIAALHMHGVVHRDLKPQNVLIVDGKVEGTCKIRLADVGLALKLEADRSSYTAVGTAGGGGVGTVGWRAPEVLAGERQTKQVDIFSAGCVFFYVLSRGSHPFGQSVFERDGRIMSGKVEWKKMEREDEFPEGLHLIRKMLCHNPKLRPTASETLKHPFFWSDTMRLAFLIDVSDILSDPAHFSFARDLDRSPDCHVRYNGWSRKIDNAVLRHLMKRYDETCSGLIRCIRNKKSHYSEFPPHVKELVGPLPVERSATDNNANFLRYFLCRFPHLIIDVYAFAQRTCVITSNDHFQRYGLVKPDSIEYGGLLNKTTSTPDVVRHDMSASSFFGAVGGDSDGSTGRLIYRRPFFIERMGYLAGLELSDTQMHELESAELFDTTAGFRWRRRLRSGMYRPPGF